MNKIEIINAGLIALCYNGQDITSYSNAEHLRRSPLFDHWYTGEAFAEDFSKVWCIQYCEDGITACQVI